VPHDPTHLSMPVQLPLQMKAVLDLLAVLSQALEMDAERHRKAHKKDPKITEHPAYLDKKETAAVIRAAAEMIQKESRERWDRFNGQRPLPFDGEPPDPADSCR
jgi:hypothetical protein